MDSFFEDVFVKWREEANDLGLLSNFDSLVINEKVNFIARMSMKFPVVLTSRGFTTEISSYYDSDDEMTGSVMDNILAYEEHEMEVADRTEEGEEEYEEIEDDDENSENYIIPKSISEFSDTHFYEQLSTIRFFRLQLFDEKYSFYRYPNYIEEDDQYKKEMIRMCKQYGAPFHRFEDMYGHKLKVLDFEPLMQELDVMFITTLKKPVEEILKQERGKINNPIIEFGDSDDPYVIVYAQDRNAAKSIAESFIKDELKSGKDVFIGRGLEMSDNRYKFVYLVL